MTHKEIAERLREIADYDKPAHRVVRRDLRELADELDPPKPAPGTLVWWKDTELSKNPALGQFNENGMIEVFGLGHPLDPDWVIYKPARILALNEVAVKVPPVSEWRGSCYYAAWMDAGEAIDPTVIITRDEAERMEEER